MDCPPAALTPKGSPVLPRGFPATLPPPLNLSTQEKVHTASSRIAPQPNVENDPFTHYLKAYLQGPYDINEARSIIIGPLADHYRRVAVNVLIDCPARAYEFIKDVQDPFIKMELFEFISIRLAAVDDFDNLVEGFGILHRVRADLCKLNCALFYLNQNNPGRAMQLYFLNGSIVHRKSLFQNLYERAEAFEDRINLVNTLITVHFQREEIEQAVCLIVDCCHDLNKEDLLLSLGKRLITAGKYSHLNLVMKAIPQRAIELQKLVFEAQRMQKRKQPDLEIKATFSDSLVQHIVDKKPLGELLASLRQMNEPDKYRYRAFTTLLTLNNYQDAYYFAREITDPDLKEKALRMVIVFLVKEDKFDLIKEIFPQCRMRDDLKLQIAYLYLSNKIERSVEIFSLLTSHRHRIDLFSQISRLARSLEELNRIIGAILIPFLNSGDIQIAINIVKNQLPGLDVEYEIYRMGVYLISNNKLEKIDLILKELTTRKKDLEAYLKLKPRN